MHATLWQSDGHDSVSISSLPTLGISHAQAQVLSLGSVLVAVWLSLQRLSLQRLSKNLVQGLQTCCLSLVRLYTSLTWVALCTPLSRVCTKHCPCTPIDPHLMRLAVTSQISALGSCPDHMCAPQYVLCFCIAFANKLIPRGRDRINLRLRIALALHCRGLDPPPLGRIAG